MISDKIKVRISSFVNSIIENDAQAFGFIKKDETSNINSFLNKLIPSILELRQYRRSQIHDTLSEALEFSATQIAQEKVRNYIDTIIDKVYFSDENLDKLEDEIWIRPIKETLVVFDEIYGSETMITQMDTSSYIRSLLNEYAKMPQYKREQITFSHEMDVINLSGDDNKIVVITYNGEQYSVVIMDTLYGYLYDQRNFILCYDIINNAIKSLILHDIQRLYLIEKTYTLHSDIVKIGKEIIEDHLFSEKETFELEVKE